MPTVLWGSSGCNCESPLRWIASNFLSTSEAFHRSQHVRSWGLGFITHNQARARLQPHTQRTAIHQGAAHLYPIENIVFSVELHTNVSQFVLGGRTLAWIHNSSPLILTLLSERRRREAAATVWCWSPVMSLGGCLQAWIGEKGAAIELQLFMKRIDTSINDQTQMRSGAACQEEHINGIQHDRHTKRWLHVKFIDWVRYWVTFGRKLTFWLSFSNKNLHGC